MSETETVENLAHDLGVRQSDALRALRFSGGSANGGEIRDLASIPNGSSTYHFRGLEERELIEHVGWEEVGRGGESKKWELTARGRAVADELSDEEPTIDELDGVLDDLAEYGDRLDSLEEGHSADIAAVEAEIDDLREQFTQVQDTLDKIRAYFEESDEEGF